MNRATFLAILVVLTLLAGLALGEAEILAMAIIPGIFLLSAYFHQPEEVKLLVERKLSAERVFSGEDVEVSLKITNAGSDLEEVLFDDILPEKIAVVEGSCKWLGTLKRGETINWSYSMHGQRGYFMLHQVRATIREPLGLLVIDRELRTDGQLFIVPPILRLRRVSIRPRRTRIFSGTIPARQGGPGVEFFDVREYQSGDPTRNINWKLTARQQQSLFTNQYEQERVVDVGIILDGRRRTTEFGNRSIFEHSVMATAALVDAFLSAGNRVGLLFYGKLIHWTLPGYGKLQGEKILHSLSTLEPGDSQAFNELFIPRRLFPAKSQLVLVSPLSPDDFHALADLRSKGYAVLVICPDRVAFEASGLPQTEPVRQATRIIAMKQELFLNRLRGIGIQVVRWDTSKPFEQIARQELERRPMTMRGVTK